MAYENPFFEIDRPGMQAQVNSYIPGAGLAWRTLFPLRYTPKFDIGGLEGDEGIPVAADRVAFNSKAPKKTRQTIGTWDGKLGKISVSKEKDELDINNYQDLQRIVNSLRDSEPESAETKAQAQYLLGLAYDDVDFCNKAMDYRVEIDAMKIGCSGKQAYNEVIDGDSVTQDVINFNVPGKNFKGVKEAWDNAEEADGIGDIIAGYMLIKGGKKPKYAYMEKSRFIQMMAQKKTAARLFPTADLKLVTSDMITVEAINRYMLQRGYPRILLLDTNATVEDKEGNKTDLKPWQENIVTLSPTINLGYTYYKPVPFVDSKEPIQVASDYYKMTRYGQINPMLEVTMAEAYVQPALTNRASLVFINTDYKTWNDGGKKD